MSGGKHKGRKVVAYLEETEFAELERLRDALATSTGRATITHVIRESLGTLALEIFDRRQRTEPVEIDRRVSPGRRRADEARAHVARLLLDATREVRRRRLPGGK